MGATSFYWGPSVFREAQKFWFYAIAASFINNAGIGLLRAASEMPKAMTAEERVYNGLNTKAFIVDGCDLLIPGSFLGWIPVEALYVSIAMSISSIISMTLLWKKINDTGDNRAFQTVLKNYDGENKKQTDKPKKGSRSPNKQQAK